MDELAVANSKVLTACSRTQASHYISFLGGLCLFSPSLSPGVIRSGLRRPRYERKLVMLFVSAERSNILLDGVKTYRSSLSMLKVP